MALTPGTEVILKAYTTESCPVCPWDTAFSPSVVGLRYIVMGTNPIPYEGVTYQVLQLTRKYPTDPGPGLTWPESAVKIAFGGGIS